MFDIKIFDIFIIEKYRPRHLSLLNLRFITINENTYVYPNLLKLEDIRGYKYFKSFNDIKKCNESIDNFLKCNNEENLKFIDLYCTKKESFTDYNLVEINIKDNTNKK